ncbi:hypothetical protein LCGC14_1059600 [marine sediment metagenome]|uniref:Uncharacterized protein n=1 Tax=marine sediment metagenome TaxID=412755 RepID=A0A0F9QSB5_9ZZZZ
MGTRIFCKAVCCKWLGDEDEYIQRRCTRETLHLQPCASDADNVMACSEFEEEGDSPQIRR